MKETNSVQCRKQGENMLQLSGQKRLLWGDVAEAQTWKVKSQLYL